MDILLAIAALVVAASALYVSASFRKRTQNIAGPLIEELRSDLSDQISDGDGGTARELRMVADSLAATLTRMDDDREHMRSALERTETRITAGLNRLTTELAAIKLAQDSLRTSSDQLEHAVRGIGERHEAALSHYGDTAVEITRRADRLESRRDRDVGALEARLAAADDELARLAGSVEEYRSEVSQVQAAACVSAGQLLDLVSQADDVLRGHGEVLAYLHSRAGRQAVGAVGDSCRVVKVSLYLPEPGADLVWQLIQSFCAASSLTPVLSEPSEPTGRASYQIWHEQDGRPLEQHLIDALVGCRDADGSPGSGLTELRNILLCLHLSGPGTIEIGPMVITRTPTALLGCILTAAEAARIGGDSRTPPEARQASLRQLGQDRIVEFTAWADALAR